jgi:hypothetical protein
MPTDNQQIEKVHCNDCGHKPKHLVVATRKQSGSQDVGEGIDISWVTTYDMLECCGCEAVCMRRSFWFSEDPEDERVSYYPPAVSRDTPPWIGDLPDDLKALIDEIYTALQATVGVLL